MRVRVSIDVKKPLRQHMIIKKQGGGWVDLDFKYERLGQLCFLCGLLGHSEQFCSKQFEDNPGPLTHQ